MLDTTVTDKWYIMNLNSDNCNDNDTDNDNYNNPIHNRKLYDN